MSTFTANRLLAGTSLESVSAKSDGANVYGVSSNVVIILLEPEGASLMLVMLITKL